MIRVHLHVNISHNKHISPFTYITEYMHIFMCIYYIICAHVHVHILHKYMLIKSTFENGITILNWKIPFWNGFPISTWKFLFYQDWQNSFIFDFQNFSIFPSRLCRAWLCEVDAIFADLMSQRCLPVSVL